MRITLIGPRSVGKSTVGKLLCKNLSLEYIESDSEMFRLLEKYGGPNKLVESGNKRLIHEHSTIILKSAFTKDNVLIDFSAGSISSRSCPEVNEANKRIMKDLSVVVGLLPCQNDSEATRFLFSRESERAHFIGKDANELLDKVKKDYLKLKPVLINLSNVLVYVKDKTPEDIVKDILANL
jgi:shikimate kinase